MASRRRLEDRFAFPSHAVHHHRRRRRPVLEVLEGRVLLATFTVNSVGDAGIGSNDSGDLRYCINQANADDQANTIVFDSTVFGTPQTITLSGGQLELSDTGGTQTITGPAAGVTISGGGKSRVFRGRHWCDRLDLRPDHLRRLGLPRRQWRRSGELRHGDAHRLHPQRQLRLRLLQLRQQQRRLRRRRVQFRHGQPDPDRLHRQRQLQRRPAAGRYGGGLASRDGGDGGGLANYGTATLTGCTLSGNSAPASYLYFHSFGGSAAACSIPARPT